MSWIAFVFLIPIIAIVTSHQQKMAEIQSRTRVNVDGSMKHELEEIKRQIAELRDTTTRFDMSFDTALQRLESRMNTMEGQQVSGQKLELNA